MSVTEVFRQRTELTQLSCVFEALDRATEPLCGIATRLIFKFVVFVGTGVFYFLCG
jgi:hypothetical protein